MRQAADLGYLLHKHPDKAQSASTSVGTAHVFWPGASEERSTVARGPPRCRCTDTHPRDEMALRSTPPMRLLLRLALLVDRAPSAGGVGMVVKPFANLVKAQKGWAPGIKVRGREGVPADHLRPGLHRSGKPQATAETEASVTSARWRLAGKRWASSHSSASRAASHRGTSTRRSSPCSRWSPSPSIPAFDSHPF